MEGKNKIEHLKYILSNAETSKISLLIRHADRYEIPDGSAGTDILLTEEGKANARKLGKDLSTCKIHKIITTPVDRCIQTAEYIAEGYGTEIPIEPSNEFGSKHITDWHLARQLLDKPRGHDEWYNRIINDISVPGICTAEQYKQGMTGFITENSRGKGLTIFVSHDFLIAFFHYALNGTKYTMFSDWVNYLSGLLLKDGEYVARF